MKINRIINEQDDKKASQLLNDLMAEFKNMKTFMPETYDELVLKLPKEGKAYKAIAQDMVKILNQMEKKGMV